MRAFLLSQPFGHGAAQQQIITGTNPVAGSSFTLNTSSDYVWRLVGIMFTLTADANAGNRYVTVSYLDGNSVVFFADGAGVVVTASSTQRFIGSTSRGRGEWAANTDVFFPLTPLYLRDGAAVSINVASIQATDTLTLIRLTFDRFLFDPSQLAGFEQDT